MGDEAKKAGEANAERISALAKRIGQDTGKLLRMFVLERFLARMQSGPHKDLLAVKGGFLMAVYGGGFTRPTEDVDLSRIGDACPEDWIRGVVAKVSSTQSPTREDGVFFDLSGLKVAPITGGGMDFGLKVSFFAAIGKSKCKVVLDVCGGNPIVPAPVMRDVPSLLSKEFPPVTLPCYPLELVVAEKLHAAEWFGSDNSRVKDFHDIAKLVETNVVDGAALAEAMKAVWGHWGSTHRTAAEMAAGEGLSEDYAEAMQERWEDWMSDFRIVGMPTDFGEVVAKVRDFAAPALDAVAAADEYPMDWTPEGGWTPKFGWKM